MNLTVIDYSHVYFTILQQTRIPRQREGKFVLIANHDNSYAVFSPRGLSFYHANIVERFFSLRGISGEFNSKRDIYHPLSSNWEVIGGGHWQLNEQEQTLRIFGESLAYGGVDLLGLSERLHEEDAFSGIRRIDVG